ncbi:unnamed protein product [Acanthoscelides obtectus]|uniref:Uncharacterized protein n=1 Tax=Acanthoscelides obtectus TaxID=200917 RepID=A0A9P0KDY0_ACAOB|nr:unnamed protein product [Acanthoscelides obtectus]CAK1676455.1 hypothetical protein AOBTE_LOCUS30768 [Acanthoscelides obtectus]
MNLWMIVVWSTINILMKIYEILIARFQAKSSISVHDFHTTFEEIQGHNWKTNTLRPKVILLHTLEDDYGLVHAE